MLEQHIWFTIRSAQHRADVDVARDEPSHIHIVRPSRLRRVGAPVSTVAPTETVPELAAEVTVQAA